MRKFESIQESINKSNFLHKTVRGLKSFLHKRCQKLPDKSAFISPFSCGSTRQTAFQTDQTYGWESDDREDYADMRIAMREQQVMKGGQTDDACNGSFMKFVKPCPSEKNEHRGKVEKIGKREDQSDLNMVEAKMRELEMMDLGDIENVLDMEEALHYYSRLRSPVYLGIVNQFLMDIYTDFSVTPQSSASINSSKRRFGSIRR